MATLTRLEPDAPPLRTANLDRLENLAGALASRGLHADVLAPLGRIPRLQVMSPGADRAEDIYAWRCQDGSWWYWWSWAERIATTGELTRAADRIAHAFMSASGV